MDIGQEMMPIVFVFNIKSCKAEITASKMIKFENVLHVQQDKTEVKLFFKFLPMTGTLE